MGRVNAKPVYWCSQIKTYQISKQNYMTKNNQKHFANNLHVNRFLLHSGKSTMFVKNEQSRQTNDLLPHLHICRRVLGLLSNFYEE